MSPASAARSSRKPASITTNTNSVMAPTAAWTDTAPLTQSRKESGGATTISVVVPVYRSEGTLRELHRRLVGVLAPQGASFEIIFVEDCGGDESWQVIEDLGRRDTRVRGICLSRNFGQHNALLCGIRAA